MLWVWVYKHGPPDGGLYLSPGETVYGRPLINRESNLTDSLILINRGFKPSVNERIGRL